MLFQVIHGLLLFGERLVIQRSAHFLAVPEGAARERELPDGFCKCFLEIIPRAVRSSVLCVSLYGGHCFRPWFGVGDGAVFSNPRSHDPGPTCPYKPVTGGWILTGDREQESTFLPWGVRAWVGRGLQIPFSRGSEGRAFYSPQLSTTHAKAQAWSGSLALRESLERTW